MFACSLHLYIDMPTIFLSSETFYFRVLTIIYFSTDPTDSTDRFKLRLTHPRSPTRPLLHRLFAFSVTRARLFIVFFTYRFTYYILLY